MPKVLLFGGSFDPIHFGHLIIARYVAEHLEAQRVVLIPSASPPHKRGEALAPAADRLGMCRVAVAGDPLFEVSDWEVGQAGPNYTLHTVQHFVETLPSATGICWLIGMDSLLELATWYRVGELVECCTVVTAARPGYESADWSKLAGVLTPGQIDRLRQHVMESPRIDVSATEIRARVQAGRSIRYLVPETVREFVEQGGLYRVT